MYYVYSRSVASGREEFINIYNTEKEAVHKITLLYILDSKSVTCKDAYYYFYKVH